MIKNNVQNMFIWFIKQMTFLFKLLFLRNKVTFLDVVCFKTRGTKLFLLPMVCTLYQKVPLYRIYALHWFYLLSKRRILNVLFFKKYYFLFRGHDLKKRVTNLFILPIAWTIYKNVWSCRMSILCGFYFLNKSCF